MKVGWSAREFDKNNAITYDGKKYYFSSPARTVSKGAEIIQKYAINSDNWIVVKYRAPLSNSERRVSQIHSGQMEPHYTYVVYTTEFKRRNGGATQASMKKEKQDEMNKVTPGMPSIMNGCVLVNCYGGHVYPNGDNFFFAIVPINKRGSITRESINAMRRFAHIKAYGKNRKNTDRDGDAFSNFEGTDDEEAKAYIANAKAGKSHHIWAKYDVEKNEFLEVKW